MILSVSTWTIGSGAAIPVSVVNGSMTSPLSLFRAPLYARAGAGVPVPHADRVQEQATALIVAQPSRSAMPILWRSREASDEALTAGVSAAGPRHGEFVALVALMTSLVAMSIDTMLPALATIGAELGARRANDAQLILSALFLGLAIAQMIYGPLADCFGRKPMIYLGLACSSSAVSCPPSRPPLRQC